MQNSTDVPESGRDCRRCTSPASCGSAVDTRSHKPPTWYQTLQPLWTHEAHDRDDANICLWCIHKVSHHQTTSRRYIYGHPVEGSTPSKVLVPGFNQTHFSSPKGLCSVFPSQPRFFVLLHLSHSENRFDKLVYDYFFSSLRKGNVAPPCPDNPFVDGYNDPWDKWRWACLSLLSMNVNLNTQSIPKNRPETLVLS